MSRFILDFHFFVLVVLLFCVFVACCPCWCPKSVPWDWDAAYLSGQHARESFHLDNQTGHGGDQNVLTTLWKSIPWWQVGITSLHSKVCSTWETLWRLPKQGRDLRSSGLLDFCSSLMHTLSIQTCWLDTRVVPVLFSDNRAWIMSSTLCLKRYIEYILYHGTKMKHPFLPGSQTAYSKTFRALSSNLTSFSSDSSHK